MYANEGVYESNYLRDKSAEYIPVRIVNGYGEVTLTSNPKRNTYLQLNECYCENIYTVASNYIEVCNVEVSEQGSTFVIPYTLNNSNVINGIKKISYNGVPTEIMDITQNNSYIYVTVNEAYAFDSGNMLELLGD